MGAGVPAGLQIQMSFERGTVGSIPTRLRQFHLRLQIGDYRFVELNELTRLTRLTHLTQITFFRFIVQLTLN